MSDPRDECPVCEQAARPLPSPDEVRAFIERHIPATVLEVFPDWQGFLMKPSDPKAAVWIVRTREDGQRLHHLTGTPALLLTDVLAQRGRGVAEARKILLTQVIRTPLLQVREEGGEEYAGEASGGPAADDTVVRVPAGSGT